MGVVFTSALKQMVVLFLFMAIGYFLKKKKLVSDDASKALSTLEIYVFCPCLNILTYTRNFTLDVLKNNLPLLGVSVALMLILAIPVSRFLAKRLGKTEDEAAVYRYALCYSNSGYLGYPIVEAVFGEAVLMNTMIFCIPLTLGIYTYGLYTLIPGKGFSLKKLLNPATITPFIGMALGLSGIKLPDVLMTALDSGSNCMAPVAMLMTGFVLARQPLMKMFLNVRAYIASLLRLVAIPMLTAVILYLLNLRGEILLIASVISAMPMGLNSVVFPEAFGGDATSGSQSTFISNVMGLITIPIMLSIFQMMAF